MTQMHTIWAREHNNIVAMLRTKHPEFSEQDLYDKARMINAACMAKIHTIEWTPAILPNPSMNLGMHSNWYGLKTAVWGQTKSEALGFFQPGQLEGRPTNLEAVSFVDKFVDFFGLTNHAINGLVGSKRDLGPNNVPFTLTEEFTSVYRLHSLLPENLVLKSSAGNKVIPTTETRKDAAGRLAKEHSLEAWISSFGNQKPGQLILNNFPAFLQDIDVPGFQKYDIGALDILRDRERGVPRYNKFRELLQLKPLDSIEELCTDNAGKVNEANVKALKEVYGGDINKVDLLVGTLAEAHRPEMFGFGETQFQIFILMASRRLMGDRFYSSDFKPEIYTQEGIDWIKQANFKNVIIRGYPTLKDHLANVENAFLPWDGSAKVVPAFSTTNGKAVPVRYPR